MNKSWDYPENAVHVYEIVRFLLQVLLSITVHGKTKQLKMLKKHIKYSHTKYDCMTKSRKHKTTFFSGYISWTMLQ